MCDTLYTLEVLLHTVKQILHHLCLCSKGASFPAWVRCGEDRDREQDRETERNGKSREEGSANNTVKKQVTLFTIRENGENCLRLFQTIWNISAASADYMLFSTWYFLHTHNKLVLCALHAGCVQ